MSAKKSATKKHKKHSELCFLCTSGGQTQTALWRHAEDTPNSSLEHG